MLAYCVPIFTKSVTIIYLSAEIDNNSICVIGARCPLSPNDCLHFRSQRNYFQRPPVNIGDLSLRICPAANEMREPCLGDQSEARTVTVTPSRWYLASLNWEIEVRGGIFDILSDGGQMGWDGHVTSAWHPRDTWHVRDNMETEDITEEFSALVEWLQTFNLQSEVTIKMKLKQ